MPMGVSCVFVTFTFTRIPEAKRTHTGRLPEGATTVVIGNSVGDNNAKLAKRYFKLTCPMALCIFIIIATSLILGRYPITRLFTKEPDVVALSVLLMPIVALKHVFDGMQGYLQGVIRGLGRQKIAMFLTLIAAYPVQLPVACILAFKLQFGVAGLWWGDIIGMIT